MIGRAVVLALLSGACGRIDFGVVALRVDDASFEAPSDGAIVDGETRPPKFVQGTAGVVAGADPAQAFRAPVTAGDLVVAAITFAPEMPLVQVIDSVATPFAAIGPVDSSLGNRLYIAYGIAPASGSDTITASFGAAPTGGTELHLDEYSGVAAAAPLQTEGQVIDQADSGQVDITTAVPNELVFAFCVTPDGQTVGGTGMAIRTDVNSDLTEDAIAGAAGPFSAPCNTNGNLTIMAAAFVP